MPEKKTSAGRPSVPKGKGGRGKGRSDKGPAKVADGAEVSEAKTSKAKISQPKVSCLLPTRDRRFWIPMALVHFQRQTWEHRELLVVDDGEDEVSDLIPTDDPRIRYIRLDHPLSLGAKRNLCCEEADGEFLIHWDDDDWMSDGRVAYQVEQMTAAGVDVCGLDRLYFCEPSTLVCWQYTYRGRLPWVAGGTLCFTKSFWRDHPFPELNAGEDTRFLWQHRPRDLLRLDDPSFYCATIHADNTSSQPKPSAPWQPLEVSDLRGRLGQGWADFIELLRKGGVEGRRSRQRPEKTTYRPEPTVNLRRGQRATAVIRCRVS